MVIFANRQQFASNLSDLPLASRGTVIDLTHFVIPFYIIRLDFADMVQALIQRVTDEVEAESGVELDQLINPAKVNT